MRIACGILLSSIVLFDMQNSDLKKYAEKKIAHGTLLLMERYESINGNLIACTVEGIEPKQIGFDMQNKRSFVA